MVDFVTYENIIECWIYHSECGVKMLAVGLEADEYFAKDVFENNIDEYIEMYKNEYMEE